MRWSSARGGSSREKRGEVVVRLGKEEGGPRSSARPRPKRPNPAH
uniref:Uncharacterized protein n=1 Tax=Arundo donax TaxID=35708 RepID=A0A0A9EX93_ARUDO